MSIKETSANVATGTVVSSGAVGLTGWVNEHYQVILLGTMIFSALVATLFYWLNWREKVRQGNHIINGS